MRISDWSSDVCSPDLPASSSVPALTSTARGSAYTSSRCRTDTDHCAPPSAHHQSQHPADWQEAAHPDPDPRPATPPHNHIGRASCRERVRKYVYISVVADNLKTKTITKSNMQL